MVLMQIYVDTVSMPTVGQPAYFHTNLPNGYYIFRLVDIMYDDDESKSDLHATLSIESDTWKIPYGNRARGHRILFTNRTNNGKACPTGYYNFLAEIRNQNMDLTLLSIAGTSTFQKMILSFDVTPTESTDTFVPYI